MTMSQDPDLSKPYHHGHYASKEMADAMAADIEKLAALHNDPIPRVEVTRDREGGWNVWVWE